MRPRGESFHHLQFSPREAFQSARATRQFQAIIDFKPSSSEIGYAITVPIARLGAEAPAIGAGSDLPFPGIGRGIDVLFSGTDHGIDLLSDTRDCGSICRHR
jgi:hypothetical protein